MDRRLRSIAWSSACLLGCAGGSSSNEGVDSAVDADVTIDADTSEAAPDSIADTSIADTIAESSSDVGDAFDTFEASDATDAPPPAGYEQPHDGTGTLYQSSGNGMDYDQFVFDDFTTSVAQDVIVVRWRGGYLLPPTYPSGAIVSFDVSFWKTIADQPDIGAGAAARFEALVVPETPAGTFAGVQLYDYTVTLPSAFHVDAGVRTWVRIGAYQPGVPGWGISAGTGGDARHFQSFVNYAGGTAYRFATGDVAFGVAPAP